MKQNLHVNLKYNSTVRIFKYGDSNGKVKIILAFLFVLLYSTHGMGQFVTWDGDAMDGEWTTATNWSNDQVPGVGTTVDISNGDAVTISSGVQTVITVSISGTSSLTVANGVELRSENSNVDGILIGINSSLINNGTIVVSNLISATADGIENEGTLTNNAGGTITINDRGLSSSLNSNLTNSGTISVFPRPADTGVDLSGTTNNNAGASITVSGGGGPAFRIPINAILSNAGTLSSSDAGGLGLAVGGTLNNNAGGEINITNPGVSISNSGISISSNGNITNDHTISISSSSSQGIVSSGTLTNNASGSITINDAGTSGLAMNNGSSLSNSGTLSISGSGFRGINLSSGNLTNNAGGSLTVTNSTSSGIRVTGSAVLDNTGSISISGSTEEGISNLNSVTNNTNGSITITGSGTDGFLNVASSDNLINAGTLTINTSTGTDLRNNGTVNNAGGTIMINGSMTNVAVLVGNLAPGSSPGIINSTTGLDISGATLEVEVNGANIAGTDFDQLNVTGTATLGGTLAASIGYTPTNGDRIESLTATSVSGTFSTINPALPAGWAVEYSANKVELVYTTPCGGGGTPGLWVGCAMDNDWTTASNWDDGNVPGSGVDVVIDNGDAVTIPSGAQSVKSVTIDGGSTLTVNNGSTLNAAASSEFGIDVSSGTSLINNGNINVSGATSNGIRNNGTVTNNASGVISITGSMNNGFNHNTGASTSNAGQFTITNSTADGLQMASSSNTFTNSGTLSISGSGTDAIDKNGGTLTNTGTTQIDGNINGLASIGGNLAPGTSPGTITTSDDFNISSATLIIEVDGTTANTEYDVLAITDKGVLGSATLMPDINYSPTNGDRIEFLTTTNFYTGNFSTINPPLPPNWSIEYSPNKVELVYTETPGLWIGSAGDGQWTTASNWSDNQVPGSGVDVVINNGDAVTISSGSHTVKSVRLNGTSTLTVSNGSTLAVTSSDEVAIDVNNGTSLINNGSINISNSGTNGIANNGTVTNNASGIISVSGSLNNGLNNNNNGSISNAGQITLTNNSTDGLQISSNSTSFDNSGTLTISGSGTAGIEYDGNTFNNTGTVNINDNIDGLTSIGGSLAPGTSPGTATIDNGFDISSATLAIEVDGTTSNTEHDVLAVTGTATLGGTLTASIGYTPSNGDRIEFITATFVSGTFSTINPALPAGWAVEYSVDKVELVYTTPCGGGGTPGLWVGCAGDNDWTTASNWDDGNVPGSGVDVVIDNGDAVTIPSGTQSVKSVAISNASSSLTVANGATLQVTNSTSNGIDVGSGAGNFTNNGTVEISNAGNRGFVCHETLVNGTGANLNVSTSTSDNIFITTSGTLENAGNIISTGGVDGIRSRNDFTNSAGGQINISGNSDIGFQANDSGNTFANAGIITIINSGGTEFLIDNESSFSNTGTLAGTGAFNLSGNNLDGTVSPGTSPGIMNFFNNQTFNASNTMTIEVDGTTPNTQHDKVSVGNTATISGTLNPSINYTPSNGDRIEFLTATSVSGTFSTINPALPAGWTVEYSADKVELVYTTPCGGGGTPGFWVGCAGDNDWTTASNWDDGNVPGSSVEVTILNGDDVTIPSGTHTVKRLGLDNSSSLTVANGATLNVNASTALGIFLNDAGSSLTNNGNININNAGTTALSFSGTFNNNATGTVNITSPNSVGIGVTSFGTANNAGSITITGAGANGLNNANLFNNQSGGSLTISGSVGNAFQASGTTTNSGTLAGTGTFNVNGNNLDGTVSPGTSPGTMTFSDDQTFTASNTIEIEVDGTTPGTGHDVVNVSGTATISGTLDVNIGYTPSVGDRIVFLTASTAVSGTFSSDNLPADWFLDYSISTQVSIYYAPAGTYAWDGDATDGKWDSPTNWNNDVLPPNSANVEITNGDAVNITSGSINIRALILSNMSDLTIANGASLTIGASTSHGIEILVDGSELVNNGTINVQSALNGNGIQVDAGALTNGVNGQININDIGTSREAIVIRNSTGLFTNEGMVTIGSGTRRGVQINNGGSKLVNSGTMTITGVSNHGIDINNASAELENSGTINISNSAARGIRNVGILTNLPSGVITANGNGTDGIQVANNSNLNNQGQLTLNDNSEDGLNTATGSNTITNSGTLICSGNTVLGLDINGGTFTSTGMLKVDGGIEGLSSLGGTIAPGSSPGITSVTGNIDISTATLEIEVDGTGTAGVDYDRLTATGTITLGGTLDFQLGYTPIANDQITFITSGAAIVGTFSSHNLPANWFLNYNIPNSGDVTLSFGASLPVEMVSFHVRENAGKAQLDWVTASEKDNRGFEVQHSLDGINWRTIGFVEGAGTTVERQAYRFIDDQTAQGVNYYRLEQMDFDGNSSFSKTVSLELSGNKKEVKVFPNPVSENRRLDYSFNQPIESEGIIYIFDLNGQLVKKQNLESQSSSIDINDLPAGIYSVKFKLGNELYIERLIVE